MAVADIGKTVGEFTLDDISLLLRLYGEVGLPVSVDPREAYAGLMGAFGRGASWYRLVPDPSRRKDVLVVKELLLPRGNGYGARADKGHEELYLHAYILPCSHDVFEGSELQKRYHRLVCEHFGTV